MNPSEIADFVAFKNKKSLQRQRLLGRLDYRKLAHLAVIWILICSAWGLCIGMVLALVK